MIILPLLTIIFVIAILSGVAILFREA